MFNDSLTTGVVGVEHSPPYRGCSCSKQGCDTPHHLLEVRYGRADNVPHGVLSLCPRGREPGLGIGIREPVRGRMFGRFLAAWPWHRNEAGGRGRWCPQGVGMDTSAANHTHILGLRMNSTSLRKTSLALAIVAAVCTGSAMASTSTASTVAIAQPTTLHHGDAVLGALPATQAMHVAVALKIRDRAGLDAFLKSASKDPLGVKPMSHDAIMANHAPTQVQAQTVANYLSNMGFKNVTISPDRMLVTADGTAASASKAFLTTFAQVRTRDGRVAFANTSAANVPALLGDKVLAVLGLQTVNQAHIIQPRRNGSVHTNASSPPHDPTEFASIYSGTGVATAAGVTVGIFTNGDVTPAITDLGTFTTKHSLNPVTTSVVKTNGGGTDQSGQTEWDIDSQDIVGMGGGQVGQIIFYTAPTLSDSDMLANFDTIVNANQAKIVNVSIGGCEVDAERSGTAYATDQTLAIGDAQGQTFSISTGDSGADECGDGGITPSWPADSPYAIAVAGTTLDASTGSSATYNSEIVWTGSGGSPSTFEPAPTWQYLLASDGLRGVADVAFDADPNTGTLIDVGSGVQQWGGTSLAAPIFSGLWARVLATKGTDFGFAGPLIYTLPQADFHDVTSGNNNGESAKTGYDYASGRGSIILSSAINDIGKPIGDPPVAGFSYTISGLSVHFTDTSTDDDGSISKRFWNFGDGSAVATSTNPSHSFA
ncbi:MAG TPA: protease pro-enzyme activation domain-containing protein, partial [Xanthomonadaceae bacterium]|nr:protease pro-enzyme activation domain-containing protein [Xanthomonadaceae bacterium]